MPPINYASPRPIRHAINNSLCTGCEACIAVCPTDVLRLFKHKSTVAFYERCIHCQKCDEVCPTGALVTFPVGEGPRSLSYPRLDRFFQSEAHSGLYLIGEAAGRPLIKNAVNMGRAAVAHIASEAGGLTRSALGEQGVDVLIIGAGPAGLSAALTCIELGLQYRILERHDRIASTILSYPRGKLVMAEPVGIPCLGLLPVYDDLKDSFVAAWEQLLRPLQLNIYFNEAVSAIQCKVSQASAVFDVKTTRGTVYRAQRVVIAIGARGEPRRHRARGSNQPHVHYGLLNPEDYRGKNMLVIGGGDSAIESALLLADAELENTVRLCVRGTSLTKANARNKARLDLAVTDKRIRRLMQADVKEFLSAEAVIEQSGTQLNIKADAVIVQIGADPPVAWLANLGIPQESGILFDKLMPHSYSPPEPHELVKTLLGPQPDRSGPLSRIELPLDRIAIPTKREGDPVSMRSPHKDLLIRLPEKDVPRWTFPRKH